MFHSFGAAARNAREAVAVLTSGGAVSRFVFDEYRVLTMGRSGLGGR